MTTVNLSVYRASGAICLAKIFNVPPERVQYKVQELIASSSHAQYEGFSITAQIEGHTHSYCKLLTSNLLHHVNLRQPKMHRVYLDKGWLYIHGERLARGRIVVFSCKGFWELPTYTQTIFGEAHC